MLMQTPASVPSASLDVMPDAADFYRQVLETLHASSQPFLVGGAFAFNCHTGINRNTKDLDLFVRRSDYDRVAQTLQQAGYRSELTFPHWLGKIKSDQGFIDVIFSSGNGIALVDDEWFEHAQEAEVFGVPVRISPVEEMIWSKAFIMEKERYDGADIAHLIKTCGTRLDWQRLFRRFDPHWRVLLSCLVLFGFVYPADRQLVPAWVMNELMERLRLDNETAYSAEPAPATAADLPLPGQAAAQDACFGTLLSREQYLVDIEQWGYNDPRLVPTGNMTEREAAQWTEAIQGKRAD